MVWQQAARFMLSYNYVCTIYWITPAGGSNATGNNKVTTGIIVVMSVLATIIFIQDWTLYNSIINNAALSYLYQCSYWYFVNDELYICN